MRTIIAGSRNITDALIVGKVISSSGFKITSVLSGTAKGVDKLGEYWAVGAGIPVKRYPADWDKYGNAAGPIRNAQMASEADALIAIWNGFSPGTADMIKKAQKLGLKVFIHQVG